MSQLNLNSSEITDANRQLIEQEHAHLEKILCDLCEVCDIAMSSADCHNCDREKVASCQGRLPSFFHDFREFATSHFEHEESIINDILLAVSVGSNLRLHREAHANLMREISRLMQEANELCQQGNVAGAIRHFHQLIQDKFGQHSELFDDPLLQQ